MTGFTENPALVAVLAFVIFFLMAAGVMVILWIALPFSVFGTKGLLMRLIEKQEKTNALLRGLLKTPQVREAGHDTADDAEDGKKGGRPPEEAEDEKKGINEEVKTIDL